MTATLVAFAVVALVLVATRPRGGTYHGLDGEATVEQITNVDAGTVWVLWRDGDDSGVVALTARQVEVAAAYIADGERSAGHFWQPDHDHPDWQPEPFT